MQVPILGFRPPIEGLVGTGFNTFRLGLRYSRILQPKQRVFLVDEKAKMVFGLAEVLEIHTGTLKQLCMLHGKFNHHELGKEDTDQACDRLFEYLQKVYGPQIATEDKRTTVIYLRRLEHDELVTNGHAPVWEAQGKDDQGGP